jgi:hypothetical protein
VIGDSHKGETLYGWGNTLPYVWKGVGDKEYHTIYKGEVDNGVPNGLGVLISTNGWKYFGSWKNGENMVKEHLPIPLFYQRFGSGQLRLKDFIGSRSTVKMCSRRNIENST